MLLFAAAALIAGETPALPAITATDYAARLSRNRITPDSKRRLSSLIFAHMMLRRLLTPRLIVLALLVAGVLLTACSSNNTNTASSNAPADAQPSPAPSPKTGFEADLDYVRKGQYTYVWIFSRKDGKPLDKTDAAYLRTNAPQVVDWVTTDEGKRVIAGTNFDLTKGPLELLKKRFKVEDYTGK